MTRPEFKMSDAERRLRIAMIDQKISREQLAQDIGVRVNTLGNIIRSGHCGAKIKRRITQRLKRQIWPDTPVELRSGKNVEFGFPTARLAADFIEQCERELGPGAVVRCSPRSRKVRFPNELVFTKDSEQSQLVLTGETCTEQIATGLTTATGRTQK
jgi:hypothetical protein